MCKDVKKCQGRCRVAFNFLEVAPRSEDVAIVAPKPGVNMFEVLKEPCDKLPPILQLATR